MPNTKSPYQITAATPCRTRASRLILLVSALTGLAYLTLDLLNISPRLSSALKFAAICLVALLNLLAYPSFQSQPRQHPGMQKLSRLLHVPLLAPIDRRFPAVILYALLLLLNTLLSFTLPRGLRLSPQAVQSQDSGKSMSGEAKLTRSLFPDRENVLNRRAAVPGFLLFIACDLCVLLMNCIDPLLPLSQIAGTLIWVFYLPSQILLACALYDYEEQGNSLVLNSPQRK